MKLGELSKIWNTPIQELMGRAKKGGLKINHDTHLTPEQIAQLKKIEEQPIARPQLPGQLEPEQLQQEPQEQMVQTQNSAPSIAAQTHTKLSQSRQAKNAQAGNLFQAAVQAEYASGQDRGLLLGLANEQGAVDAYMAVQQAFAGVNQADLSIQAADRASFLSQDNNLLGELENPCKSYSKSEETIANARSAATATQSDLTQILKDLHSKSSTSVTESV
ncbi:hypothetical protein [Microcoleus sp. Pol12B5]|uniref:hypothetical protein n=1 Tax=Microcoleus sp. Pol12B5 TaxID=3055396 RepID=UPI002FCEBD6F